ncbi:hypothetical protein [Yinghuangia sp. ASG 101]|nr:hypothetical protein [Yinghuangia sp. ASG 101]
MDAVEPPKHDHRMVEQAFHDHRAVAGIHDRPRDRLQGRART